MIKFFRRIRKSLLQRNKISKYFKYAIGEIVLVVVGILIALAINNWNEKSKENKKEATYLKNIQRDLKNQLQSIEDQIEYEKSYIDASFYIMSSFKESSFKKIDTTFFKQLTILQSRKTFVITDPTYTDLLSSGNIDIIKNKEFKDLLIQYYQELELVEKIIQNNNSLLVDQQFANYFIKLGYYFSEEVIGQTNYLNKNKKNIKLKYLPELAKTAKDILSQKENALQFMNALGLRNAATISSFNLIKESKQKTEQILARIQRLTND